MADQQMCATDGWSVDVRDRWLISRCARQMADQQMCVTDGW